MADKNTFGLDKGQIDTIDWELAIKRVLHDIRSDFIYAPHLRFIYAHAADELVDQIKKELAAGAFAPGAPLHIEVPKSARMKTAQLNRLGPAFSRQGSILMPRDRVFYQALADEAAPTVKAKTDLARSFSHRLGDDKSETMFVSTRTCWSEFQKTIRAHSEKPNNRYVLKTDVANCFGSLNQHTLINTLQSAGMNKPLTERLEKVLTAFTGSRSSRGILQGIYPSDMFGSFYLDPIDRFLADAGLDSARYVDDIYVFVDSGDAAETVIRDLISVLRSYDLILNENKSVLMPVGLLLTEEPDLEQLFKDAVDEISGQLEDSDFGSDYGFQSVWDDEDDDADAPDEKDLELQATINLFESIEHYPDQAENIERFCLPLFAKAESNYAVDHVQGAFKSRPAMAQIYCAYLANFLGDEGVVAFLISLLGDGALVDWQKMWVMAALLSLEGADDPTVKIALDVLKDASRHEALRGAAAIFVGRFGDIVRRKSMCDSYGAVGSPFIQLAIFFSSRWFPAVERTNAFNQWSTHTQLHSLLATAMKNKPN